MNRNVLDMIRQRLSIVIILATFGLLFTFHWGMSTLAQPPGGQPDRYVEDKLTFIGQVESQPVLLILTFSRGTAERDVHTYAAECTGHLFSRERWTHLGPGGYTAPETTLAVIPSGPGFRIGRDGDPPTFSVEFDNRGRPLRLALDRADYFHHETADADYQLIYRAGTGTLIIDADTVTGTILHRELRFIGYNRLAGNIQGYFPGKYEQAALVADDGTLFILSTDPICVQDTGNRVNPNFAVAHRADSGVEIVFDSLETRWPLVDDTLYPGKPLPLRWISTVEGGEWRAEYRDLGHFFYFTGFGMFAVEGTMRRNDTTFRVIGVVEHIHARDKPR